MELKKLYKPVEKELGVVETLIGKMLSGVDDPVLKKMNALLLASKGKRLRPAFVLLSACAANEREAKKSKDSLIKTAAAFELIHLATLVHDDVMDENTVRHGKPTVNKIHGDASAIGVGDFLFSKAFVLLAETKNAAVVGIASKAIATVCEGQIYQLARRGSTNLTMKESLMIIEKKTATLFEAACEAGTMIVGEDTSSAKQFGRHFGIAFQLVDDYFDIMGTEKMLGKKPGENLHEGEATIPIFMLLQKINSNERKTIMKKMFLKKGILLVKKAIVRHKVGEGISKAVERELEMAAKGLDVSNRCVQSLLGICKRLEARFSVR